MSIPTNNHPTNNDVFELLHTWRHLPFYPLEPRVTVYFAVFLRDILCDHCGIDIQEAVIPEFPLLINSNDYETGSEETKLIDYVAFSKDKQIVYLIELKTDLDSVTVEQTEHFQNARLQPFPQLVSAVKRRAMKANKKQKYVHLLHQLAQPGLEIVSTRALDVVKEYSFPKVKRGYTKAVDDLQINDEYFSKTIVVYIQPKPESDVKPVNENGFKYIFFEDVAKIVENKGDLGTLFANYLRQWTSEAGSDYPSDVSFLY